MGSTEVLYDNIEQYLDGSLQGVELEAFEARLKMEQELQIEVNLHRNLVALLADSPEDAFRDNLKKLSSQMKTPLGRNSWRYLLILFPIVLLTGWWSIGGEAENSVPSIEFPKEKQQIAVPKKNIEATQPDLEGLSPEEIKAIEKEAVEPIKEVAPNIKSSNPKKIAAEDKNTLKTEPSQILIASADFDSNPSLEFLIENNQRGGEITFEVENRQANVSLESEGAAVDFRLSGSLISELNLYKKDFNLHIFSNKKTDYQNFLPLFTGKPKLSKIDKNTFKIDYRKAIILKPGRYYYLLEDAGTEELFFVEKFEVN